MTEQQVQQDVMNMEMAMANKEFRFVVKEEFDIGLAPLEDTANEFAGREEKLVLFNRLAKDGDHYRAKFDNEFVHLSKKIHVQKGSIELVDVERENGDSGKDCEIRSDYKSDQSG